MMKEQDDAAAAATAIPEEDKEMKESGKRPTSPGGSMGDCE